MKKIYLLLVIFVTILLVFTFFYKNSEKSDNENFQEPKNAFVNSLFAVKYKYWTINPEFGVETIKNIKDKSIFDNELREKLIELLNMPFIQVPTDKILNTINTIDKGSYNENKITLLTSDISISNAYLLVPKNIEFPAPAVIAMHQHGGNYEYGKEEVVGNIGSPDLAYGKELAERGYIVLAMDAPLFGKRFDTGNNSRNVEEMQAVQDLLVLGHSPLGVIVQEDIISLDYLSSLDIVDKENIGCIGHSFGGIRCMYLSALDKRIKVTVLSSSVANLKKNPNISILHTWLTLLPGIAKYTETSGILALISPRPLMIVHTENDPIYPAQETQQNINSIYGLYTLINKKENFDYFFIKNEKHTFPKEIHDIAFQFMDKHLKNQKI